MHSTKILLVVFLIARRQINEYMRLTVTNQQVRQYGYQTGDVKPSGREKKRAFWASRTHTSLYPAQHAVKLIVKSSKSAQYKPQTNIGYKRHSAFVAVVQSTRG